MGVSKKNYNHVYIKIQTHAKNICNIGVAQVLEFIHQDVRNSNIFFEKRKNKHFISRKNS